MDSTRASMARQLDDWRKEREATRSPPPTTVRTFEAMLTYKGEVVRGQASRREICQFIYRVPGYVGWTVLPGKRPGMS
jgi:hypothetical protein